MATNYEQVQQLYIALFGRPADVAGRDYWGAILGTDPGALATIAQTFSQMPEYAAEFGGKSSTQIVTTIYDNLFGHAPSSAQLSQWSSQLSGPTGIGAVVTSMINGAAGADASVLQNKVNVAVSLTASLDTAAEVNAYKTEAGRNTAEQFINYVDDLNSVSATNTAFGLNLVTSDIVAGRAWSAPAIVAQQVQDLYVAYFSRAADRGGFDYWTALLDGDQANPRLQLISGSFAASAEYKAEYSQSTNAAKVNAVYENLFSRAAEPTGRDFWVQALDEGRMTIDNAVTNIAAGAQGTDLYAYRAKVNVAQAITAAIDTPAEIQGYTNASALAAVTAYIAQVKDVASFNTAINAASINNLVAGFSGQAAAPETGMESVQLVGVADFEPTGMMA